MNKQNKIIKIENQILQKENIILLLEFWIFIQNLFLIYNYYIK